jgi:hypothetical protein
MDKTETPYRTVSPLRATVQFVFMPERFARQATRHDVSMSFTLQPNIQQHCESDANHLAEYEEQIHEAASMRMNAARRSLFSALRLVGLSALAGLACGWLLSKWLGSLSPVGNTALQVLGAAILLWAAIWQLSAEQQTMSGETLVERVHSWLFRSLCVLGTIVLFVAYGWAS